jgi:hypothetical protein
MRKINRHNLKPTYLKTSVLLIGIILYSCKKQEVLEGRIYNPISGESFSMEEVWLYKDSKKRKKPQVNFTNANGEFLFEKWQSSKTPMIFFPGFENSKYYLVDHFAQHLKSKKLDGPIELRILNYVTFSFKLNTSQSSEDILAVTYEMQHEFDEIDHYNYVDILHNFDNFNDDNPIIGLEGWNYFKIHVNFHNDSILLIQDSIFLQPKNKTITYQITL